MNILQYRTPRLAVWPSFDRYAALHDEMSRLFAGCLQNATAERSATPALDFYENDEGYTVAVELPGFKKEEIGLSLHEGTLTISGERKAFEAQEGQKLVRQERATGAFETSIQLSKPVDVSNVTATYTDGILTVVLRKSEEAKPKQITINVAE